MAIAFHKNITSRKAIFESILVDRYIYQWFTFFVFQPFNRKRFQSSSETNTVYKALRLYALLQVLTSFLFVIDFILLLFSGNTWYIVLGGAMLFLYLVALDKKRKCVAILSIELLLQDFKEEELNKKSIFQITEHYSQSQGVPSLVDAIYQLDRFYRKVAVVILFLLFFVYPMGLDFIMIAIGFGVYYFFVNLATLRVFYQKIK